MFAMMFGGDSLTNYQVGSVEVDNVQNNTTVVTTTGMQADLIILIGTQSQTSNIHRNDCNLSIGFCNGALDQVATYFATDDGVATSTTRGRCTASRIGFDPEIDAGFTGTLEVTDISSGSFTLTTRDDNMAHSDQVYGYVALEFEDSINVHVGTETSPTSTGNRSESNFGFVAEMMLEVGTTMTTLDQTFTGGQSSGLSFNIMDHKVEASIACAIEDGQGTTDTQSQMEHRASYTDSDDGTLAYACDMVSWDAGGLTRNWL